MKKLVRYYSGPFTYTGPNKSKKYTHITDCMYEDFNRNHAPVKRIGVRRKQNGLCWLYYKEFFEGEEKPEPAPEFFDFLRNLGCRYPEKISFWHLEEVDDNGNVVRSVESSES